MFPRNLDLFNFQILLKNFICQHFLLFIFTKTDIEFDCLGGKIRKKLNLHVNMRKGRITGISAITKNCPEFDGISNLDLQRFCLQMRNFHIISEFGLNDDIISPVVLLIDTSDGIILQLIIPIDDSSVDRR